MLETEDQPPSEISVCITNKDSIQKLNHQFRDINEPTDVLSWPMAFAEISSPRILGDIVICEEIAESQSDVHGHAADIELACLAVHGGLHLLGYSDESENEQKIMDEKMIAIMNACNFKPNLPWRSEPHA